MCVLAKFLFRKPTEVSYRYTEKGDKVRVSDRTGRIISKPPWERRDWKSRTAVKGMVLLTSMHNVLYFFKMILLSSRYYYRRLHLSVDTR